MKKKLLVPFAVLATSVAVLAAPDLQVGAAKNLARQHLGANLYQYNPGTQAYSPTQASAAWLDDDVTTGWPAMMGKQYYLLALPDSENISSFALSARPSAGTVSLFVSDQAAPPTSKVWTSVASDVPLQSLIDKKSQAINHPGKYLLIETNIADPGSIYSLYVYGDKPAAGYAIKQRSQAIDTRAVYGPYTNDSSSFNVAGLYAQAQVKNADSTPNYAASAMLDDNPESAYTVNAGTDVPVSLNSQQPVSRIAMKVDAAAKGRFDFFLTDGQTTTLPATPAATLAFDGASSRSSVELTPTPASQITVRWTPSNGTDAVAVAELEAFAGQTLAANAVMPAGEDPAAIAEGRSTSDGKSDPKAIASRDDKKDVKPAGIGEPPPQIAEGGPYLPGALGFPPNLSRRTFLVPPVLPPEPPPVSN